MIGLAFFLAVSGTGLSAGELFIRCTDLDPVWYRYCEITIQDIVAKSRKTGGASLDLQGVPTKELVREFTSFMRASPWHSPSAAGDVVEAALLVKHQAITSPTPPRATKAQTKSRAAKVQAKSRAAKTPTKSRATKSRAKPRKVARRKH